MSTSTDFHWVLSDLMRSAQSYETTLRNHKDRLLSHVQEHSLLPDLDSAIECLHILAEEADSHREEEYQRLLQARTP